MGKKVIPAEKKAAVKKATTKPKVKPAEEAAQDKKDMSNMITTLKKATSAEKDKVQLLEIYQSLPRFSEEKLKLLKQWKLDKSCKWIGQYQESRELSNTTSESTQDGFATKYLDCICFFLISSITFFTCDTPRYQVAEICKLPVDSPEMAAILKELPADDDWDEEVGIERGYKKAGLKRFHVQGLKGFKTTTVEDKSTEEVVKTKQAAFVQKQGQDAITLSSVKDENPLHTQLVSKLAVAEGGKQALEKVRNSVQDLAVDLQVRMAKDKTWENKHKEMETALAKLQQESMALRTEMAQVKALEPTAVTQAILDKFILMIENVSTLVDVAKSQVRKTQGLLQWARAGL